MHSWIPEPRLNLPNAKQLRTREIAFTRGRKFSADELQLMLLSLLHDAPAHGYELIKRFDDISHGYYSPSPGVLYPALSRLEAQGFTRGELNGKRKDYRLTSSGQDLLAQKAEHTQQLFAVLKHAAKKMLWVNHANDSMSSASDATGWLPEFVQARKALQAALLTQGDASHAAQRRIIAVLQQATNTILNQKNDET